MHVVVNYPELRAMMGPTGEIRRKGSRAAGRVRDRAKRNAPVNTGLLRNSISARLTSQRVTHLVWTIGSDVHYAPYQELGTGPIFPRRAPALVFQVNGRWVSTQMTRGVPAVRYLTRAIEATTIADFV